MREQVLRVGDLSIAVHESDGSGPAVVFLHGNSQSSRVFRKQVEGDLGKRFHLVAFDLPGHGDSSAAADPSTTYTFPGYARVLLELASRLGIRDVVVVGSSLGGHVVLEASEELPQAAGFLIFGAPPVAFPPAVEKALVPNPHLGVALRAESADDDIQLYLSSLFGPGTAVPRSFHEDFLRTDKRARAALGASISLRGSGFKDETAIVSRLSRPLAILHGAHDRVANGRYVEGLSIPSLWRGRVQVIPDAGHTLQWERPVTFDALVDAFVREVIG